MKLFNSKSLTQQHVLFRDHHDICETDRTPAARDTSPSHDPNMTFRRDHKAGSNHHCDLWSNTLSLKGNVRTFSKIPIATHTTPHPQASRAASSAAASINIESQEPSSRGLHSEGPSYAMSRRCNSGILEEHCHKLQSMHSQHQLWMLRCRQEGKDLNVISFPICQFSHSGR